ncbi:efflux RND transporter periplasmic adaptor subunit [uncultured Sphingomonas sp.]|uniref:HlyD family secretion protein n=1 Tax=uncultured Sphingomonas sp. TaxID=158754 RepID=UPI0025DFD84C|nr:efflux RND transporter periplasmic adaptor subunit [uncultured Sphingomonas sp.]
MLRKGLHVDGSVPRHALLAVIFASLSACTDKVPGEDDPQPPIAATAGAVANGRVDVEGGLIAVAARTPGTVATLYVREGDHVVRGQPLAKLDSTGETIAVEQSEASTHLAKAKAERAEFERAAAEREYRRLEALRGSRAIAGQALDKAHDEVIRSRIGVAEQRAALALAQTDRRRAVFARDEKLVSSPGTGTISQSFVSVGTGISTLNVSTLFTIAPDGPRIVRAEVAENALKLVHIGQHVQITPESDKSRKVAGLVKRIAPVFGSRKLQSDQASQRTDERVVEVVVSTSDSTLLIGQRVLVRFL